MASIPFLETLFNTINNIDILIEKDPKTASSYLNKLSEMMRFMLYETKTETISLESEVKYIEKYVELQKIRTSNPDFVKMSIKGNANGKKIVPMLFIPFIENAFKHVSNKKTENAIEIHLEIANNKIEFECSNWYSTTVGKTDGIGNELIQKRLNLLYPNKHVLQIVKSQDRYTVKLTLNED
jgi:two-component system LytT family sensor kinase